MWLRMSTLGQNLVQRARILLLLNAGQSPKEIADLLEISTSAVFKLHHRYRKQSIEGPQEAPKSGQPQKLAQKKVKSILKNTIDTLPPATTHWTIRLMAEYAGVARWPAHQIWQATDFKPHRLKTFDINNDPEFAKKVFHVVSIYPNPPDNTLVLSIDEKTQIRRWIVPNQSCNCGRIK